MNDRAPLIATTRRHFLHASAALGATALCSPGAAAAPSTQSYTSATFAIEVEGVNVGVLDTLQLPEYIAAPGAKGEAAFSVGPFRGSVAVARPESKLLEWIMSLPRGKGEASTGVVRVIDSRDIVKRNIGWKQGRITEVGLPVLSRDGERFVVELAWQAAEVSHNARVGKAPAAPRTRGTKNAKVGQNETWWASRFRLKGLPLDSADILKIDLPTISTGASGPKVGNLTLELGHAGGASIHPEIQKMIADGRLTADEHLDLAVELLDGANAQAIGAVQLYGCGLRSYREPKFANGSSVENRYTLTFSVERCDLSF